MRSGQMLTRPLYRLYEDRLMRSLDRERLPRHIGVIHDGHRRFARAEGLPDYASSHRARTDKFVRNVEHFWYELNDILVHGVQADPVPSVNEQDDEEVAAA